MSRYLGIDLGTQSQKAVIDDGATAVPDPDAATLYDRHYEIFGNYLNELRPLFE